MTTNLADQYAYVIRDLREKRAGIDKVISTLESMSSSVDQKKDQPIHLHYGMTLGEMCAVILRASKCGLSTAQIMRALSSSGYEIGSTVPTNNVWGALNYRAKKFGDVKREGRHWVWVGRVAERGHALLADATAIELAIEAEKNVDV